MPLSDIQPPPTQFFLTGWGAPLVYAPDRCHLAEVGPINPIKWTRQFTRMVGITPMIQVATTTGIEWRENEWYAVTKLPQVTPSIKAVYAQ